MLPSDTVLHLAKQAIWHGWLMAILCVQTVSFCVSSFLYFIYKYMHGIVLFLGMDQKIVSSLSRRLVKVTIIALSINFFRT